jgi:hypothetical protein
MVAVESEPGVIGACGCPGKAFRCTVAVEVEVDAPGGICEGEAVAVEVKEDGRVALKPVGRPKAGEAAAFATATSAGR